MYRETGSRTELGPIYERVDKMIEELCKLIENFQGKKKPHFVKAHSEKDTERIGNLNEANTKVRNQSLQK